MNLKKLNLNAARSFTAIEARSGMTRKEMSEVKGGDAFGCLIFFVDKETGDLIDIQ